MKLLEQFQKNWHKKFADLLPKNHRVLLAVSGGLDSVVMADLFTKSSIDFAVAHCNFKLRGEDSDEDEVFVRNLAERYGKEIFIINFDTQQYASQQSISIEEAARNLRYHWFSELLNTHQDLDFVATAHHANDNIETVLMNFFRGTGLQGMTGIPERNDKIIRPLLFATKQELEEYFENNETLKKLGYRTDVTNFSDDFTRNAFRLNIIPLIKKHFPDTENNILNNISRFSEINDLYKTQVETQKKKLFIKNNNEFYLPVLLWQKNPSAKTLLWEYLKQYNFSSRQIPEIEKLFSADNGSHISSATHRIFKNRKHLVLTQLDSTSAQEILIEKEDTKIEFTSGNLFFTAYQNDNKIISDKNVALLNIKEVKFPLMLRKWKTGDYFYPLGMKKKKKLSRFFIDNKLSLSEKENCWVIESDKRIIWIVGQRIDERFKIKPSVQQVLKIEFYPNK